MNVSHSLSFNILWTTKPEISRKKVSWEQTEQLSEAVSNGDAS